VTIAKIFRNGKSQAVRLPKAFRFKGDRVHIKRMGEAVVLLPYQSAWSVLFESLTMFSDDFMVARNQPPIQKRELLFK
jgi:antitoxin VapB